jgi:LemA protein
MTSAIAASIAAPARAVPRSRRLVWATRALGGTLLVAFLTVWTSYNRLVDSFETANAAWGQVTNVMQRRADLLPNLIAVTAAYAAHERALLDSVSSARDSYKVATSLINQVERMRELEALTSRVLATEERYPELKASPVYAALRFELLGTENRIATERSRYNEAVRAYRTLRRRWPSRFVARALKLPDPPAY